LNTTGLSTDQAPPISVPLRFFITVPVFGIIFGLILFVSNPLDIVSFNSPIALSLTHIFTLGMFAMMVMGAIFQMLPVVAGVSVSRPILISSLSHLFLVVGTLMFVYSFLYDIKVLKYIASTSLLLSFGIFFGSFAIKIFKTPLTPTVNALRYFAIFGGVAILLGVHLLISWANLKFGDTYSMFVLMHMMFAFFGFGFILIVGIAYQVVPMFYVAPQYPDFCHNHMTRWGGIFLLITASILVANFIYDVSYLWVIKIGFLLMMSAFSSVSFMRFKNRRRKISDPTIWFWLLSLGSLFVGSIVFVVIDFISDDRLNILMAYLLGIGFIYSMMRAMVFKIVSFMSWFHLSALMVIDMPNIKDFISDIKIKRSFYLHIISFITILLSINYPSLLKVGGVLFVFSEGYFLSIIAVAIKKYYHDKKSLKRFDTQI